VFSSSSSTSFTFTKHKPSNQIEQVQHAPNISPYLVQLMKNNDNHRYRKSQESSRIKLNSRYASDEPVRQQTQTYDSKAIKEAGVAAVGSFTVLAELVADVVCYSLFF